MLADLSSVATQEQLAQAETYTPDWADPHTETDLRNALIQHRGEEAHLVRRSTLGQPLPVVWAAVPTTLRVELIYELRLRHRGREVEAEIAATQALVDRQTAAFDLVAEQRPPLWVAVEALVKQHATGGRTETIQAHSRLFRELLELVDPAAVEVDCEGGELWGGELPSLWVAGHPVTFSLSAYRNEVPSDGDEIWIVRESRRDTGGVYYVPPLDLSEVQVELYRTFRRDGMPPEIAAQTARSI